MPALDKDAVYEDASAVIADFNQDQQADLFVSSGGGQNAADLQDRLYWGTKGTLQAVALPKESQNGAVVKTIDYDRDGDLDVFVGNNSRNNRFGSSPESQLLQNNKGIFTPISTPAIQGLGMVSDATVTDFNRDGQPDLIVVGEWMAPVFLANKNGKFTDVSAQLLPEKANGLWQTILPFDIDHDGDEDYVVGNWGMNSKFKASAAFPMKMYYDDFDKNGSFETIVTVEKMEIITPLWDWTNLLSNLVAYSKRNLTPIKTLLENRSRKSLIRLCWPRPNYMKCTVYNRVICKTIKGFIILFHLPMPYKWPPFGPLPKPNLTEPKVYLPPEIILG